MGGWVIMFVNMNTVINEISEHVYNFSEKLIKNVNKQN